MKLNDPSLLIVKFWRQGYIQDVWHHINVVGAIVSASSIIS